MKIGIVSDVVYPYTLGGREKRLHEITRGLVEKGHEIHIYTMNWWKGEPTLERDGLTIHGVCPSKKQYELNGKASVAEARKFQKALSTALKGEEFDVIDCDEFPFFSAFAVKKYSKSTGTPMILTWHEVWDKFWYEYLGRVKGQAGKFIEKRVSRLPGHIVAVSHKTRRDLIHKLGVPRGKVSVVPSGGIYPREILAIPPSTKQFDVLYAGRLADHKNVDVLIKAVKLLSRKQDIQLGITGDGTMRRHLEQMTQRMGLRNNIEFLGVIEDQEVLGLMKSSTVFVNPSSREGFGIVFVEAMASGCPIIGVKGPYNTTEELIQHGNNGMIVNQLEPAQLAKAIEKVIANKTLRNRMSHEAMRRAKQYEWKHIVNKMEATYEKCIESSP